MVSISTSTLRIQSSLPIWFMGFSSSLLLVKVCEMDEQGWRVLCVLCVRRTSREMQRGRARGEVRIDETNPIPLVLQDPPCSAGEGLRGLPAFGRGCRGGKKYRHGEQRRMNGLRQRQGGLRAWCWEKLSDGKESDGKGVAWGGCKTPSPPC